MVLRMLKHGLRPVEIVVLGNHLFPSAADGHRRVEVARVILVLRVPGVGWLKLILTLVEVRSVTHENSKIEGLA